MVVVSLWAWVFQTLTLQGRQLLSRQSLNNKCLQVLAWSQISNVQMQIFKASWEDLSCRCSQPHKELWQVQINVLRQVLLWQLWNKLTQAICQTRWISLTLLKMNSNHLKDLGWAKNQVNKWWFLYYLSRRFKTLLSNRDLEAERLNLSIILTSKMFLRALIKELRNLLSKTRSLVEIYLTMMMKIWEFSQMKAFSVIYLSISCMKMSSATFIPWNTQIFRKELTL